MALPTTQSNPLIEALLDEQKYDHPVAEISLIETHISWVILTGDFAYKIKKPVNFGFLDFSSLAKRKQYCEEELRLNSRTAAEIYLEVVSIRGTIEEPTIEEPSLSSDGETIEYAVKMKQFPQQSQLDRMLMCNELTTSKIDAFSQMVAKFHQTIDVADEKTEFGNEAQVLHPVNENLVQIRKSIEDVACHKLLDELACWIDTNYQSLQPILIERKRAGFIRECHGDLHLRNLAWIDNKPVAFDCIEFNAELRWIDVISDIAFLIMDLQVRKQPEFAQQALNSYLEVTGDYSGVQVLSFYLVYRALVRAKVDALNMTQSHIVSIDNNELKNEFYEYLSLAKSYTKKTTPRLIITHGVSASGKTTFSQQLLQVVPAIRIRSDVERKRMANIKLSDSVHQRAAAEFYTQEFSDRVYNKLEMLSGLVLGSGYSVIVDAAFLNKDKREQFRAMAKNKGAEFVILSFSVVEDILRERIKQRSGDVSDADITVLENQLNKFKPLDKYEEEDAHFIKAETTVEKIADFMKD